MLSSFPSGAKRKHEIKEVDCNGKVAISTYKALKLRSVQHPRTFGRDSLVPARSILPRFKSPNSMVYQFVFPDSELCTPFTVDYCHNMHEGHMLAVGDEDGRITLLRTDKNNNADNADYHHSFYCHKHSIVDVKWSQDDTMLLTAATDRLVRLWDTEVQTSLAEFPGHEDAVKTVNWHPNNEHLIVTGSKDGSFRIWDTRYNQRATTNSTDSSTIPVYNPIKVAPDAHNTSVPRGGRKTGPQPQRIRSVTCAMFLKNDENKIVSSGSTDGTIKLWDIRQGRGPSMIASTTFATEAGITKGISDMKIDSSGQRLFSSCSDNSVYMHYLADLSKPALRFSDPDYKINSFDIRISLSPDDRFLLSGSSDMNIFAWEVDHPNAKAQKFEGHTNKVTGVSWNKTSVFQFASCSEDFNTRIWSFEY
ncbi:WD40-repeat-containing domain protein [Parasitella parasitica]|nr:WD40-repeat-containing domain protein [Parasitella parasitica]